MTGEATGLMAFWADIDAANREDYRRWHNCEHMAERVGIAGFLRGRRYRGFDAAPDFLMYYETEAVEVLGSAPYHAALNAPTHWTKQALGWFRNPVRAIYARIAAAGEAPARAAPYLVSARFNLAATAGDADARVLAPLIEAAPGGGLVRARLFAVDEAISGIATSERKIYGGGPGNQRYLALFEFTGPLDTEPDPARFLQDFGAENLFLERYSIDFALDSIP